MIDLASQSNSCRVCGSGPTIDAHLFPRALGHDLRGPEKNLFVGGLAAPGRRIVQAGLFDPGILCAKHDSALGLFDNYGIEFCRTFEARHDEPEPNIWRVSGVDSDKLVKFWLAVLWRFGISSLHEAEAIRLGPYEDRLRDILFSGAPCPDEPAVLMFRYRSKVMPPENICFPPYLSEFPGLSGGLRRRAYGIAVAGFHAFVKIDAQPLPHPVPEITVNRKDVVQGGYLEFENTHQFRRLVEIANNMSLKPRRPGARR